MIINVHRIQSLRIVDTQWSRTLPKLRTETKKGF
ncbi:hypothetical protein VCHENC02_2271A, partial [Vibrio harveyi]